MINKIKNNPFAVNSIILFSGSMLGNVLNYVFHLVVGRMVSVEIYGEVESLVSLITIVSVPAMTLAMIATKYSACSRADNDKRSSNDLMAYLNKKVFVYGLPVFALAMLATPFFKEFLNIKENMPLFIIWLMMFLALLGSINNGILVGWQKFKDASWVSVLGAVVKLISAVILIKFGFVLSGAVGSFAIGALASYIASIFTLRFILREKRGGGQNSIDFQSVRKYAVPALIGNLAISILGNADMVLAKHNLDSLSAGQYGALTIVSKVIFFATGVIATVLFTMSAEGNHRKNSSRTILIQASGLMLLVSVAAIGLYFAFPKLILSLLFGDKYSSVSLYMGFFAVVVSLFSFANLFLQYLLSIQKTKIVYWLLAISILEVILILFLGKNISGIITLVALIQVLAIVASFVFLFEGKTLDIKS